MATKTKTRTKSGAKRATTRKSKPAGNAFSWEDFRPEWASEQLERISTELEKWSDELQSRGDELRARGDKFRTQSQKRVEKRIERVQKELRKVPAIKRAEELRKELNDRVEKNIDAGVDRVYTGLRIARLDEVKKLERKIAQLNKKLSSLEKLQAA